MSDHQQRERLELIQVLAVGAASVECMDQGVAEFEGWVTAPDEGPAMQGMLVLDEVGLERLRQDEHWGPQKHGRITWAMILGEEIGEWAEELVLADEELTDEQIGTAGAVIGLLKRAGIAARKYLEDANQDQPEDREATPGERARDAVLGAGGSREEADAALAAAEDS